MTYRGPNPNRIQAQESQIALYHAETATWRVHVSGETANSSAYFAGAGRTEHYRETTISGLFATYGGNSPMFRELQQAAGMSMSGDLMVSTFQALGDQDEITWRGVRYLVQGDSVPVRMGGRVWYRTVLTRGDAV